MALINLSCDFSKILPKTATERCMTLSEFSNYNGFKVHNQDRFYFWNIESRLIEVTEDLLNWCGFPGRYAVQLNNLEEQLKKYKFPYNRELNNGKLRITMHNEVFTHIVLMFNSPKAAEIRHMSRCLIKTMIYYQRYQMEFNKEQKRLRKLQLAQNLNPHPYGSYSSQKQTYTYSNDDNENAGADEYDNSDDDDGDDDDDDLVVEYDGNTQSTLSNRSTFDDEKIDLINTLKIPPTTSIYCTKTTTAPTPIAANLECLEQTTTLDKILPITTFNVRRNSSARVIKKTPKATEYFSSQATNASLLQPKKKTSTKKTKADNKKIQAVRKCLFKIK